MVKENFSCIKEVTKIVNLTLPSVYNTNEISGICDVLESWKRQYVKQLQGIVVGYKNVSLTSKRGYLKADCPVIYCNVKATFELFYPTIGSIIKGKINRISQDHIGCLVHDTINVAVHQTADISSDISKSIVLDRFILFQITDISFKSKFIQVKGKITEECVTLMKESGLLDDNNEVSNSNVRTYSFPDFCNDNCNLVTNNNDASDPNGEFNTSTDSSQVSSHKKKKKRKKDKESSSISSPLLREPLENDISQIEFTQSFNNTRKRKRKKSDVISSPTNASNSEIEPIHPKKKIKTEHITSSQEHDLYNDKMDCSLEHNNSSSIFSNVSDTEKIDSMDSVLNSEEIERSDQLSTPVKKKKHKKSKNSLETSTSLVNKVEIDETEPIPSKSNSISSPNLFGESLKQIKQEKELEHKEGKKKKASSDKNKSKKKKNKDKDKEIKGSKKDKKRKPKVISTKKKLAVHNVKLKKKKKEKHKKSKIPKKSKSKTEKIKDEPK